MTTCDAYRSYVYVCVSVFVSLIACVKTTRHSFVFIPALKCFGCLLAVCTDNTKTHINALLSPLTHTKTVVGVMDSDSKTACQAKTLCSQRLNVKTRFLTGAKVS